MLLIKNLTANYGGPDIVHQATLEVREGEIVTLIGPNGAGKSTILKSLFGLTNIVEGEILFFGENLVKLKTEEIIRRGIAYVPQGRPVFPSLTVEENLVIGAYTELHAGEVKRNLETVYRRFPRLQERRSQRARLLSGGEQQMVGIGRALMIQPKLMLLDEPSAGLAPKIVEEVFQKCMEIKKTGTAIFMVEQNANLALEYSDRGYVLELGRNRFHGTGKELLRDEKVGELYLGKTAK